MGAFKPLLPFGKTTVIRRCIENLHEAGVSDVVVVLGHRADAVQASLENVHLKFALNPDPESEMSASIACGVRQLAGETKAVLIALVDQPAIPPSVISTVVNEWHLGEKLIIPEFKGRGGHPVLVDLSWRQDLLTLDSYRGLKAFFDANRTLVRRVPVDSPYIARDLDTWDDYRALHEEIFGTPPNLERW